MWLNTYGNGSFAGHITYKGQIYPTNNNHFKITGILHGQTIYPAGRKLGCYRDRGNEEGQVVISNNRHPGKRS